MKEKDVPEQNKLAGKPKNGKDESVSRVRFEHDPDTTNEDRPVQYESDKVRSKVIKKDDQ